jgi:hypothetical protein
MKREHDAPVAPMNLVPTNSRDDSRGSLLAATCGACGHYSEVRAWGFGNIIEERLLEKRSTSDTTCWLSKAVTLRTRRWILSSPCCQKLPSSFPPTRRLSSCSLPASDGWHRYVPLFQSPGFTSETRSLPCAVYPLCYNSSCHLHLRYACSPIRQSSERCPSRISGTNSAPFSNSSL